MDNIKETNDLCIICKELLQEAFSEIGMKIKIDTTDKFYRILAYKDNIMIEDFSNNVSYALGYKNGYKKLYKTIN